MFSVLVIRLRSLRLLRVSGIVMRLRMFLLLITFLKSSHSFRNRLLVIRKNDYILATTMIGVQSCAFRFSRARVWSTLISPFMVNSWPAAIEVMVVVPAEAVMVGVV